MKMRFKVGVSRWDPANGRRDQFEIHTLDADSTLVELYPCDDDVMSLLGLREDQPGYAEIEDFAALEAQMDKLDQADEDAEMCWESEYEDD